MSKPWGSVGAWALDAERAEAEELERAAAVPPPANPLLAGEQSFPSLKESAASSKQQKKKKPVAVPLSQFVAGRGGGPGRTFESKGLTPDEMLRLPTGPRDHSQEETGYGRFSGGLRSYGDGGRSGFTSRRADEGDGSWGGRDAGGRRGYGGFDEEPGRGPPARASDFDQPSRADEDDNWGAGKKSLAPPLTGGGRRDSYGAPGGGFSSRADEMDDWSAAKKPLPANYPSFRSGFRDSRAVSDSDRYGSREGSIPSEQGRPRLVLDPPKKDAGKPNEPPRTRPSPFGAARPREEVLAEKGLDWRQMDSENEVKRTSRPTSSHSSRPSSSQSNRQVCPGLQSADVEEGATVKPKPKMNPFGDAKPREVLLQEKGIDWKKVDLDLEHRRVERTETNEERMLKEQIDHLKSLTKETKGDLDGKSSKLSAEELSRLQEEIAIKEKDLELLVLQLDDTLRFGQRAAGNSSRPGSSAGRSDTSSTRPPSQSGRSEGSRSNDFVDRPRSRGGTGDAWVRPMDDRRGFHRGRDKGFFDSRNGDRSSYGESRW